MQRVSLFFWILLAVFLCIFIYGGLFFSPNQKKRAADISKKSVQILLGRVKEKVPQETSISLDRFQQEISPQMYETLKNRNLFARYREPQKGLPKVQEGAQAQPAKKEEPPPPLFIYKGTMVMGAKQVVILREQTANRSYFLGKGDRFKAGSEGVEYELIDITEDKVILSKTGQEPQEVVIPKKTP